MELVFGMILLAAYVGTVLPLYRLLRSPSRPAFLTGQLWPEHLMLGHLLLLVLGLSLVAHSQL
jgi:hypothetical protein